MRGKNVFKKGEAMEYEVFEYNGVGYDRTMHFGEWRVAFLNYAERFDKIDKLERHMLTDEVFVLLEGRAVLIIGEDQKIVELEKNKIYNVKQAIYHAIKVTEDAKVLIVENHNTSKDNTEYLMLEKNVAFEF